MNKYATQGRLLIMQLQKRPHTYLDMLSYGISVCPWKRVAESLYDNEVVKKGADRQGRTTWRVVKATRWTA